METSGITTVNQTLFQIWRRMHWKSQTYTSLEAVVTKSIDYFVKMDNHRMGKIVFFFKKDQVPHILLCSYEKTFQNYHWIEVAQNNFFEIYPCSEIEGKMLYFKVGSIEYVTEEPNDISRSCLWIETVIPLIQHSSFKYEVVSMIWVLNVLSDTFAKRQNAVCVHVSLAIFRSQTESKWEMYIGQHIVCVHIVFLPVYIPTVAYQISTAMNTIELFSGFRHISWRNLTGHIYYAVFRSTIFDAVPRKSNHSHFDTVSSNIFGQTTFCIHSTIKQYFAYIPQKWVSYHT